MTPRALQGSHADLAGIEAIGIDEIQWQRGHRYLTWVYQIDEGRRRLLWLGQERRVKTFLGFFRWFELADQDPTPGFDVPNSPTSPADVAGDERRWA